MVRVLLFILCCCAAAANAAPERVVRVALTGLSGVGMTAESLAFDAEHLAQHLRTTGLQVITAREVATLLKFDRQRQLLGCESQTTSCLAELAAALGADAIVVGDIGHFGDAFQLNIKVLSGSDAHVIGAKSTRVQSDVAVLDALELIGHHLAAAVLEAHHQPVPSSLLTTPPSTRTWGFLPLGIAVASGIASGVLWSLAQSDADALRYPGEALTSSQADALRDAGKAKQVTAFTLLGVAGASLLTAVGLFVFGKEGIVLTLIPTPAGAHLGFALELP